MLWYTNPQVWIAFGIGVFVGTFVGVFVLGLLSMNRRKQKHYNGREYLNNDELFKKKEGYDEN